MKRKYTRYKRYWHGSIISILKRKSELMADTSMQAEIIRTAIKNADFETSKLHDGKARLEAVELVYIKQSHSMVGAAQRLYASERTIKKWCSEYIVMVGRNIGF